MKPVKQYGFLDSPGILSKLRRGFYLVLCLLLSVDLLSWLFFERKIHFVWEGVPFFYAVYGFVACVGLIFAAKLLRFMVKRKEEYYD